MEEEIEVAPLYCIYGNLIIPQRYVLLTMLHLSGLTVHISKHNMLIILYDMYKLNNTDIVNACPEYEYEEDDKEAALVWPEWAENYVIHGFFGGYMVGNIPGGWLADKYGGRHVLGISMLLSAIILLTIPMIIHIRGYMGAIWVHVVMGVAQGPALPAIASLLQNWVSYYERGYIGAIAYSGISLGAFLANLTTGTIIDYTTKWESPFYIWGSLGLLWYILSLFTVFSQPSTHPFISEGELEELDKFRYRKNKFNVPWLSLLTSTPIWALLLLKFADGYTWYTLVQDLPRYMRNILKWNIQTSPAINAVPFLGMWISTLFFIRLANYLQKHKWSSLMALRKIYAAVGVVGAAICILIAAELGCSRKGAITFYIAGLCLKAPIYIVVLNCNDLSRQYPGTIFGIVNGLASISGVLAPKTVDFLVPKGSLSQWRSMFWLIMGISLVSTTVYLFLAKVERQSWDYAPDEERESETISKPPPTMEIDIDCFTFQ